MSANVSHALAGDPDILGDEIATMVVGGAGAHETCSLPDSWLRLVADLCKFSAVCICKWLIL